jgi:hypothetical protein
MGIIERLRNIFHQSDYERKISPIMPEEKEIESYEREDYRDMIRKKAMEMRRKHNNLLGHHGSTPSVFFANKKGYQNGRWLNQDEEESLSDMMKREYEEKSAIRQASSDLSPEGKEAIEQRLIKIKPKIKSKLAKKEREIIEKRLRGKLSFSKVSNEIRRNKWTALDRLFFKVHKKNRLGRLSKYEAKKLRNQLLKERGQYLQDYSPFFNFSQQPQLNQPLPQNQPVQGVQVQTNSLNVLNANVTKPNNQKLLTLKNNLW